MFRSYFCISILLISSSAFADTTYTCPAQYTTYDDSRRTTVITHLNTKTVLVDMNIFTQTDASSWSSTADMNTQYRCDVFGDVIDQGSRVLLACNCIAPKDQSGISPIRTNTTLIVAAGSQCSYAGNLQFTCE